MKKILCNRFVIFILGGLIFSSITAYATMNYQANQIIYKNTTLDVALDDLYSSTNIETYVPAGHFVPSGGQQVIPVNGKKVIGDIIIDPVPSSYHELSSTTATAADILNGKTAYNGSGQKIVGTHPYCTAGSHRKEANSALSLDFGFNPAKFTVYFYNPQSAENTMLIYDTDLYADEVIFNFKIGSMQISQTSTYRINGSILSANLDPAKLAYQNVINFYWYACE